MLYSKMSIAQLPEASYLCMKIGNDGMNHPLITSDLKLRELIENHPQLLNVMSRFGLSFGFGEKSVGQVCADDGVDSATFIAVSHLACNAPFDAEKVSLPAVMGYLRNAHSYFVDYLLPSIRRKLVEAVSGEDIDEVAFLLLKFFDDYVAEVRHHMEHENDIVFRYVNDLLEGTVDEDFRITDYALNHESTTRRLNDLKDIFIRHYHVRDNRMLTSALLDIISCGNELELHSRIEDELFTPAVEQLEESLKIRQRRARDAGGLSAEAKHPARALSMREKEIIACVARGLTNKEIAERLFLSVHTVTTHRRNISAKLQIHSAAGLTIFAILNNIIDIREVNISD